MAGWTDTTLQGTALCSSKQRLKSQWSPGTTPQTETDCAVGTLGYKFRSEIWGWSSALVLETVGIHSFGISHFLSNLHFLQANWQVSIWEPRRHYTEDSWVRSIFSLSRVLINERYLYLWQTCLAWYSILHYPYILGIYFLQNLFKTFHIKPDLKICSSYI